jgi:hypothetical protein
MSRNYFKSITGETSMKRLFFLLFLFIVSCGQSPEQLFETAEFEMLQTNYPHATELYQEILDKHPDSKFAESARKSLRELQARQRENGNARGK